MADIKQVLCSKEMVERIKPIKQSKFIDRFWEKVCSAEYDIDLLDKIPDEEYNKRNVRRRSCVWANIPVVISDRKLKTLEKLEYGIFWYICDTIWASTEKNVTAILQELANVRRMSLIDFIDKFL